MRNEPLVDVRDLHVRFITPDATIHAVNGVDFSIAEGEVLAVLGESGSGKSVTLRSLIRLLPPKRSQVDGTICIAGHDVLLKWLYCNGQFGKRVSSNAVRSRP